MKLFRTTNHQRNWWQKRKIDWTKDYLSTWNHPHRFLITEILKTFNWFSLIEIGCGAGENLVNILKAIPDKQLGGIDINPDAIEVAKQSFVGGIFKVCPADDVMMSDKSTDVILSDACLIYVSSWDIKRHIREVKRIARTHIIFCELHSTNWWKRLKMKFSSGYNVYNYKTLLTKMGFYDISLFKIPKELWPGTPWEEYGWIILAKVPKRG